MNRNTANNSRRAPVTPQLSSAASPEAGSPPQSREPNACCGSPHLDAGTPPALPPYFVKNWNAILVNVASLLLFTIIVFVIFVCYQLSAPYFYGFTAAILASITLHPTKRNHKALDRCTANMRRICKERTEAQGKFGRWVTGPLLSLWPYNAYLLGCLARFFGLNKFKYKFNINLYFYDLDLGTLHLEKLPIISAVLVLLFAIQLSNAIFVLGFLGFIWTVMFFTVMILPFDWFMWATNNLVKAVFFGFIIFFFGYTMSVEVVKVKKQVSNSASGDHLGVAARFVQEKVVNTLLEEVSTAFNRNNVTQTALEIQETFGPLVGNLTWQLERAYWQEQATGFWAALTHFAGDEEHLGSGVQQVYGSVSERVLTTIEFSWKLLISPFFSIIFALTEFIVFFYTLQFLRSLPNTVLYSVLWKAQAVLHPYTAGQRARLMEDDIIIQFWTLFQSFWHISVFHFGLSFAVLKRVGFGLPGLFSILGVAAAIFPVGPKFITSCFVALIVNIVSQPTWIANLDVEEGALIANVALGLCWYVQFTSEEWLLKVEGQHSHPPFVIGMTMICGLMAYGMKGVVLGPLIVIMMITCYDAWGWDTGEADKEEAAGGKQKDGKAAGVKPGMTKAQQQQLKERKRQEEPRASASAFPSRPAAGRGRDENTRAPSAPFAGSPASSPSFASPTSSAAHPVETANMQLTFELTASTSRNDLGAFGAQNSDPSPHHPARLTRSESPPPELVRANTTMFSIDDSMAPPAASASFNHLPFSPDPKPAVSATTGLRRRKL